METVTDFIFLGYKITANGDCSHEIKRCFLLGRKAMTKLDSMLKKQRHYFANKDPSSQSYGFSSSHVWMWEVDHKAEHRRIDAFELWYCIRLLIVPWKVRRSNQSILKEISPAYSLEGLMLKLKLQILWPPDANNWPIGKDPDAVKDWRQGEKRMAENKMVGWRHQLVGHKFELASGVGNG